MDNNPLDVIAQLAHQAVPIGDWHDLARCAETDPELFFPEKGESTRPAKGICRGCEVSAECLQESLDGGERFGVWGGLSERERRVLAVQLARRPSWTRQCPAHGEELSGGPVLYHCPAGQLGHGVTAAGLEAAAETHQDAA